MPLLKSAKLFIILLTLGLFLAGCQTNSLSSGSKQDRTLVGGALGAATGAVVGGAIDGGGGAAVGAVTGGLGGALIGSATTPKNCIATDRHGRRYYVACP